MKFNKYDKKMERRKGMKRKTTHQSKRLESEQPRWKTYNHLCYTLHGMIKTLSRMEKSPLISVHMGVDLSGAQYHLEQAIKGLKSAYSK